jgi:hypothetical protein
MLKKSSTDKLTELLALSATGQEQDWEIELANEQRIGEFLAAYEEIISSPDDKLALMALILASTDQYIESKSSVPAEWKTIANILVEERELHQEIISYWRCDDDGNGPGMWFPLTPYIRALDIFK